MTTLVYSVKKHYYREVITAVLIVLVALFFFGFQQAQGAVLTGERTLLQSSLPSPATSWQEHRFVAGTTWASNETFTITMSGIFLTTAGLDYTDMDLEWQTAGGSVSNALLHTDAADTESWSVSIAGHTLIRFTTPSDAVSRPASGDTVTIQIGTNASGGSFDYINPVKAGGNEGVADIISFDFSVNDGGVDTGRSLAAIIEGVSVSVIVAESLSAGIGTVSDANCDTDFTSEADASSSTETSIVFGSIAVDTFTHACHDITFITNAINGVSVTAEVNTQLFGAASTNTIIAFAGDSASPTQGGAWASEDGFGYSCDDKTGTACASDFVPGGTNEYRPFADVSEGEAAAIFASTTAAGTNTVRVDYRVKVPVTQATDTYSNVITYIWTPTF